MCLVSEIKTPLVAEKPILVYKMLKRLPFRYRVKETPYQNLKISFEKGVCTLSAKLKYMFIHLINATEVSEGIHAWKTKTWANEAADCYKNYNGGRAGIHYAVIPKGEKYFVGKFDIVSEKMIIFLNKRDLKKSEYAYLLKEAENAV